MSSDNSFDTSITVSESESESESELWDSVETSSSLSSSPLFSSSAPSNHNTTRRPLKRKVESFDDSAIVSKKSKTAVKISFTTSTSRPENPDPFIIAGFQNATDEAAFNAVGGLPTGVIWEIKRLVSLKRLITLMLDDVDQLRGSNADAAPKTVAAIIKENARGIDLDSAFAAERKAQSPWVELDMEEAAISVNPNAALGNCDEYSKGYGGKVSFTGSIEEVPGPGHKLKVTLDRLPLNLLHSADKNLKDFFRKPFVIFGDVFRSFYAKDGTVFLFKTREYFSLGTIHDSDSTHGLSLFEFLDQFNPLELNANQALCKWASRFALGLSNSVPGPILDPANVTEIGDFISEANSNMTDGCGISNLAFNLKLRFDFKLETMPCAVQVRHGGRKGMLLLWPDSTQDATPKVAFRNPSQVKIAYSDEVKAHPANATVDILRFSRTKCPARVSPEVIVNLEHNGVPAEVFIRMQEAYIAQSVDDLISWAKEPGRDTPEAMMQLWIAVEKSENVCFARRVREAAGEARFRGFGEQFSDAAQEDEDEEPELFDTAIHKRSTAWWPDYISGCPSSLAETCMVLLDSGFMPQSLPVLRDKLKQIVLTKIRYRTNHFKYDVVRSASAFVVPDCWDVLEENEIHFKSSRRQFLNLDGSETDTVLGEVLMTRNPCKVPTDVRKLRAVKHNVLHDLVDVIVCSVKGQRRLLDFLAGGDYDGDTAIVIWDKDIVDSFTNALEKYSVEPKGLDFCFTRDETTVAKFNADYAGEPPDIKAAELQRYLLGSLRDPSAVGQYSGYHDNSILTRGYDNPRTVKLAYQFCKILDSAKTGYNLKPESRNADARQYGHVRGPAWKNRQKEATGSALNTPCLERKVDPENPMLARPFIMDVLNIAATSQKNRWLADVEALFRSFEEREVILDPDLAKPWHDFEAFANEKFQEGDKRPRNDLVVIGKHVEEMYRRHGKELKDNGKSETFTDRAIEVRQDKLRVLSHDFAAAPRPDQLATIFDSVAIARLRASHAYIFDHHENEYRKGSNLAWSRFPWNVALGDLCKIKADALGPNRAVTIKFYEHFRLGGDRR